MAWEGPEAPGWVAAVPEPQLRPQRSKGPSTQARAGLRPLLLWGEGSGGQRTTPWGSRGLSSLAIAVSHRRTRHQGGGQGLKSRQMKLVTPGRMSPMSPGQWQKQAPTWRISRLEGQPAQ